MTRPAVLITGAAKRVGAVIAQAFAREEYDVALHHNSSEADAVKLRAIIEALGVECVLFQQDLIDLAGISSLVDKVKHALPRCTILVNNASVFERADFMGTDEALFDRQFAVNFKAPFFLTQAFARSFQKGSVINILDTEIARTGGSHFAYLLSKKVLGDFTEMAARALGPDFRINAVCPGCIIPSNDNEQDYEKKMAALVPLRQHPTPQDLAATVVWLAQQPYLTAQTIYVDAGQHVL